jgi:CRISPR system Cascade subunit CasE
MYLARLRLNQSRVAVLWTSNPYRVHQRLRLAYPNDPRLLFRIEETSAGDGTQILIQSHTAPDWSAFADFPVLLSPPEYKVFEPKLTAEGRYLFRLQANPTIKRKAADGRPVRQRLWKDEEQRAWLSRKLAEAGAVLVGCTAAPRGNQYSRKNPQKYENVQTHFAVLFEGVLAVKDPDLLRSALETGFGSAKGYGFGLLSLARA